MAGEDALERIREFAESDTGPMTPLRSMAVEYLKASPGGYGELENRLVFAAVCDTLVQMDARLKMLERGEVRF